MVESATQRALLRGVSFIVATGERVGIVGESGSGKSLLMRGILGLLPRGLRITGGTVCYEGRRCHQMSRADSRTRNGRFAALIPQDARMTLSPVTPLGRQISVLLRRHREMSRRAAGEYTQDILRQMGVREPKVIMRSYLHQVSGGEAQRICIACAIAARPQLLVADEPTTGLDMNVQRDVLKALGDTLRSTEGQRSLILVSHDVSVVAAMCDRIVVLYAGKLMEIGSTFSVLNSAANPYTQALLRCAGTLGHVLEFIPGSAPDLRAAMHGCAFASRCGHATQRCSTEEPVMREIEPGHWSACHNV